MGNIIQRAGFRGQNPGDEVAQQHRGQSSSQRTRGLNFHGHQEQKNRLRLAVELQIHNTFKHFALNKF